MIRREERFQGLAPHHQPAAEGPALLLQGPLGLDGGLGGRRRPRFFRGRGSCGGLFPKADEGGKGGIAQAAVRHAGVLETRPLPGVLGHRGAGELGPGQVGAVEDGLGQIGAGEIRLAQIGLREEPAPGQILIMEGRAGQDLLAVRAHANGRGRIRRQRPHRRPQGQHHQEGEPPPPRHAHPLRTQWPLGRPGSRTRNRRAPLPRPGGSL